MIQFIQNFVKKKKEIDDRCEKLNYNSNEYKNYNKANEVFEKAKKTFEQAENTFKKAEEIYNEFKSNLDENHSDELDVVRDAAAQEKQIMMELVDPNHETFSQCLDCKKMIQRDNVHSCWITHCESNQNYCANCFGYSDGGFKRNCQYCRLPACSNDHHYMHVKECSEYFTNNICGSNPDMGSFDDYEMWSQVNWSNEPEDSSILFRGRIDRENFCNKLTENLNNCHFCGKSFCSNCSHMDAIYDTTCKMCVEYEKYM